MREWSLLKKLIWLKKGVMSGVEWDWETVSGTLPLSLDMALKKGLQSLTQYGAISQASTPSPSSPQEIVCNNGTLRMVDDELPAGYKRLLGLTYNNNVYYGITNFKMRGSDTLRFSFKCTMGTPACNVLGAYDATSAQTNYSLYLGGTSSAKYLRYNGSTYNSQADQNVQYDVVITPTGSTGMKTDSTWTEKTFESDGDLCIGTTSPTATSSKMVGDIIGNIQVDNRLKLVPCERMSDNTLGYYDLVGETFYEPTGSGVVSMGYDGSHYSLQIVGTTESLTLGSQSASAEELLAVGDYEDEQDIITGAVTRRVGVVVLDGTETGWALSDSGTTHRFRGTKPADCYTPSSRAPIASTHFKYNSTGQATGGAFVGASTYWYFIPDDQTITTENAWKAWLAAQYAAGTPVIVLYPLAEEVTEQVQAQPLKTAAGSNSLTGVVGVAATFEAVYAKEVAPAPKNLFDPTKAVAGREVDATTQYSGWYGPGVEVFVGSDYIPVVAGKTYSFGIEHTRGGSSAGLAFYNDVYVGEEDSGWRLDYQCVESVSLPNLRDAGFEATAPAGATKMMFCFDITFNPDWQNTVTVYEE